MNGFGARLHQVIDRMRSDRARFNEAPKGSDVVAARTVDEWAADLDALLADLPREPAENKWQPIETAPKDGTEVLMRCSRRAGLPGTVVAHYQPGGHCIEDHPAIDTGWYYWNGSLFDLAAKPTHWLPLPDPPPLARPPQREP